MKFIYEKIKLKSESIYGQVKYLADYAKYPTYEANEVKYFPLGEDAYKVILRELKKAEKFVFIEYEGNQIMLEEINDNWNTGKLEYPFGRGINISMTVNNINEYYNDLKNKEVTFLKDIMVNKYRVDEIVYEDVEFLIQDPDGYLLRFNN